MIKNVFLLANGIYYYFSKQHFLVTRRFHAFIPNPICRNIVFEIFSRDTRVDLCQLIPIDFLQNWEIMLMILQLRTDRDQPMHLKSIRLFSLVLVYNIHSFHHILQIFFDMRNYIDINSLISLTSVSLTSNVIWGGKNDKFSQIKDSTSYVSQTSYGLFVVRVIIDPSKLNIQYYMSSTIFVLQSSATNLPIRGH